MFTRPLCSSLLALLVLIRFVTAADEPAKKPTEQPTYSAEVLAMPLETPEILVDPGEKYTDKVLDYAMTTGIERTPGGRLWSAWFAGGDSEKGLLVAATSDDAGLTWTQPRMAIDPSDAPELRRRTLVANFWTDPRGRLWLFFDHSMGYFDGRAGVWAARCDNPDAASPTWTKPERIWHGATLNKPTVLKNGDWLLPVSLWTRNRIIGPLKENHYRELDKMRMAHVFVSTDEGKSWERRGGVVVPNSEFDEHMMVELKDGRIWMLARTGYGIAETFSSDGGRSWSDPKPSTIKNTSARFFLRRLASGRILLVKNGDKIDVRPKSRSHLTAYLSDDEGATWSSGLVLDERDGVSYPDGFQAPDGMIYIQHDRNRATDSEVLLAKFRESDISAGRLTSDGAKAGILVHKAKGGKKPAAK